MVATLATTQHSQPQSAGRSSSLAGLGAVAATVANFGIALIVTRAGASFAGVFYAVTAVISIAGNSMGLGTMTGQVFFMPRAVEGSQPNPRSLLRVALVPVILASSVMALLVSLSAPLVAGAVASSRAEEAETMLRVLAWVIPAWAVTVPILGATRGLGSMTATVVVNQVTRPLGQIGLIGAVFLADRQPSLAAVALAWATPIWLGVAIGGVALWRLGGLASHGPPPVSPAEFWRFTRPRSLAVAAQIGLERIDVILVSLWAGEASAGIYGTLSRFATAGNFLVFSLGQATAPTLRRAINANQWPAARAALQRSTGWIVLVAWPYLLLVGVESQPLAQYLSPELTPGASALTILALAMAINAFTGPIDLTLLMLGASRSSLVGVMLALVVDVVLTWWLVPILGINGAALAWGAAVIVQNGLASVLVYRASGLVAPARPALIAAAGAIVAVVPIGLSSPETLAGMIVTGVVAFTIWAGWALVFRRQLQLGPMGSRQR